MDEKIYEYLHTIIAGRAHPNSGRDHAARLAYLQCLYMLEYAHQGNLEALKWYDHGERPPEMSKISGEIIKALFNNIKP